MAHIFDVMATVNGQLNSLYNFYNENGSIRESKSCPMFTLVSFGRAVIHRENVKDPDVDMRISHMIIASTGDDFNPVYIGTCANLAQPIVDKVPIIVNKNDKTGPGVGYVVGVPEDLFQMEVDDCAKTLVQLYQKILSLDPNMTYSPGPALIRLNSDPRVDISTYDITMMLTALACAYINLNAWFKMVGKSSISASFITNVFTDEQLPKKIKERIEQTFEEDIFKISSLREGIGLGTLLQSALY